MTREKRRKLIGLLFVLPGLISYFAWTLYPIFKSFIMSLFEWNINPAIPNKFIGLANYFELFQDPKFYTSLKNTMLYTAVTVPGQMILGFLVAILLNRKMKGQTLFRLLYYLPVVTSWVIVSILFQYLFAARGGLVNFLLKDILHIIPKNIAWLSNPKTAMVPIYTLGIWKGIGWSMLIFLAGLQGIPKEIYEAASLDGANSWKKTIKITIPLMVPTIVFELVMLTIGGFNVFLSVYVMTGGGPMCSTEVLSSYMFKEAFDYFHFGYGAAISVIFFLIVFTISQLQRKLLSKRSLY
ncbi:carbohydrate ABC transporter permease [Defluviitoga tunisiensis]|jgi:multiple sugar transport system permease protein|uniref:ABC-type sugar transport systems, permease components n=1 Tax=Defluviitoga tunisiensis TaxID=1006576 RepID=A0A0C7NJ90_DEFTU|nr:sugar ABC transporter permease [Defluviitoga tunisiensis]CEP78006.1 ABC-type sugar transport systems, permease components [Defluviitoga tunisiensis]HOB55366.1 sugar ABC transporter permease [Defluviitoga tunisiensis]HPZ66576.1 sugar ABC transporter permease [Defluviitoga tunisiensis]HQD63517.1 sugar ABC transporter permease [Defluviitoga sp.]